MGVAAALRLTDLGNPHELVFDETYYVKDAYSVWQLGYEGTWPEGDTGFEAGRPQLAPEPSFVVHPPLGKWILGIGMAIGGIDDAAAWRWPAAVVGVLLVALVIVVGRGLTRSWLLGSLAGLLLAIDGQAIVMSRTVLLDQTLALLVLLGASALLLDRRGAPRRIAEWRRRHPDGVLGPALWSRPWIVAAGVALGAACAVKWSGAWFLAAFGLWTVLLDALDRRRAGVPLWHVGTLVTQAPTSFLLLVPPALATYLVSWSGWLRGGYGASWAADDAGNRIEGLSWLPLQLQSLIHLHQQIAEFHVGVTDDHPFESPASEWMLLLRPTAFFLDEGDGQTAFITALPNPLVWYASVAALVVLIFLVGYRLDRTAGFLVVAVAAGYLPWLAFPERTIFAFYTIVLEPFLILGLVVLLARWLRPRRPELARARVRSARIAIAVLVVGACALTVYFAPIWYGIWLPDEALQQRFWVPRWR